MCSSSTLYHAVVWESGTREPLCLVYSCFGVVLALCVCAKCTLLIYADPSILAEHPAEMLNSCSWHAHLMLISSHLYLIRICTMHTARNCCSSSSPSALWAYSIDPGLALSSHSSPPSPSCQLTKRTPAVSITQTSPESRWRCLRCPRSMGQTGRHY